MSQKIRDIKEEAAIKNDNLLKKLKNSIIQNNIQKIYHMFNVLLFSNYSFFLYKKCFLYNVYTEKRQSF